MAKATPKDIGAAGDAMSVLQDISSGYYPKRDGDDCDDFHFDPEDPAHLRKFYDLINATLDTSPGWPGRVIGGMCYVILYSQNRIVDPAADCLELHPRFGDLLTTAKAVAFSNGFDAALPDKLEALRAAIAKQEARNA